MADTNLYVTVKTVDPKRIECATLNCTRDGNTQNRVQGKLAIGTIKPRPIAIEAIPAIWVDVYLCDFCMERLQAGIAENARIKTWDYAKCRGITECLE